MQQDLHPSEGGKRTGDEEECDNIPIAGELREELDECSQGANVEEVCDNATQGQNSSLAIISVYTLVSAKVAEKHVEEEHVKRNVNGPDCDAHSKA
ncbi:hypothetical protein HDU84_002630, partial [Entophlyctis sp. JEL0112]